MATEEQILKRLRKLCLALPEARETVTFGHPTFQAGKKTFAVLEEYRGKLTLAFRSDPIEQQELTIDPRYFITPYTGKHGWVSLIVEGKLDWSEIAGHVQDSYRRAANQRMLKALDRDQGRL